MWGAQRPKLQGRSGRGALGGRVATQMAPFQGPQDVCGLSCGDSKEATGSKLQQSAELLS